MGIKQYNPTSKSLRTKTTLTFDELTTEKPFKGLTNGFKKNAGRSTSNGQISVRRKGGGHKRRLREIDFKRNKYNIPGKIETVEYDPNRSSNIALVLYSDGERRYIVAPESLKVGDSVVSGEKVEIKIGNSLPLKNIPIGTSIYNIELHHGKGGQLVRSAGVSAQISGEEGDYCLVKLPSGELRKVLNNCYATIGEVGNKDHINITIGKAGRSRWMHKRPKVRGVVMNPVDHPHGGGEGKTSGGRHPVTPWGQPTKGYKTRKRSKYSNNMIITRRK